MPPWQLISMEVDQASKLIGDYFEHDLCMPIKRTRMQGCHTTQKKDLAELVKSHMGNGNDRKLVLYGSGYFHHYTYELCRHADRLSGNYAYMHFDHHSDFGSWNPEDEVDCASFVSQILTDTNASAALFFGDKPPMLDYLQSEALSIIGLIRGEKIPAMRYSSMQPGSFRSWLGSRMFERQIKKLPEDVYLSFDLDLMSESEIFTDFYQGDFRTEELLKAIDMIKRNKRIIS